MHMYAASTNAPMTARGMLSQQLLQLGALKASKKLNLIIKEMLMRTHLRYKLGSAPSAAFYWSLQPTHNKHAFTHARTYNSPKHTLLGLMLLRRLQFAGHPRVLYRRCGSSIPCAGAFLTWLRRLCRRRDPKACGAWCSVTGAAGGCAPCKTETQHTVKNRACAALACCSVTGDTGGCIACKIEVQRTS